MSHAALPTLRTPRLTLRSLTTNDADAVFAGVSNHDVIRWLGRIPYPYAREDALVFIQRVREAGLPVWAVEDADGFVGVAGVDEELGYWFARPAWGKGYGFESAVAVLQHWFSNPSNGEVASGHYNDNARSARILTALGFAPVAQRLRFARALSQDVMGTDLILTREAWETRQAMDIRTKRLRLRPWGGADAPALMRIATRSVARMTGSMVTGWTVPEAEAYIAARQWNGFPGFMLAIEREDKMIGVVGCGGAPVSLMYALGEEHWGQGYASEATSALLATVFDRFPITRLHADCFEDNLASARVLWKLGFEEIGRKTGTSLARLEPAPVITYALSRDNLRGRP